MKELDNSEFKKWDDIRKKGLFFYVIRWIFNSVIFMIITQGTVLIFNRRNIVISDILIGLMVYVTLGIIISIIRWRILDKKHKNLMKIE